MRPLDWVVLVSWLVLLISYGLWRGRGSNTVNQFLLAGKTMPWYAMGLSIMATQAGAITFISTPGQAYVDGMRFVQFYFGLPIAMVILSATVVPIFHRAKVYTAYEYLEQRFDAKTRALVSVIFLIERGLSAGIALAAPGIVLSAILHLPFTWTTIIMGCRRDSVHHHGRHQSHHLGRRSADVRDPRRADSGAVHRDSSAAARAFLSWMRQDSPARRAS